jgi:single-stranded-DNA-specific exonuclease
LEQVWKIKAQPSKEELNKLKTEIPTLSEESITLLLNRGIDSFGKAKDFFNPSKEQIHNPFLMKDMDKAVEVLTDAISNGEKILLYGDYDVDGTCSVSMTYLFLKEFHHNLEFYIPDRYSEGYGVSDLGVKYAVDNDFSLVITMDCGIRANDQIEELKNAGIKVIVCDHHEAGEQIPCADAVLDAKQEDCNYPFKELCGCGVAFKLMQAFSIQHSIPEENLLKFIDLLSLATCADIVPIIEENRVFVKLGLEVINQNPSMGLQILKKTAGYSSEMDVRAVVFGFAPRINAAGRIHHAYDAVNLLIAQDLDKAHFLALEVEKYNQERRELDKGITEEALEMIAENPELQNKKTTVLASPHWHKGVIGIVASRCIEHYHRPTIILKETDEYLTGSARSVGDFDLLKALTACDYLLEKYGGHKFAAGLTLKKENFTNFCQTFESVVSSQISEQDLEPTLWIDQELPASKINFNFWQLVNRMEPFGPKNMQPVFLTKNIELSGEPQLLKEEHLKFSVKADDNSIDCIAFGMKDKLELLKTNKTIEIAYSIDLNIYKNTKKLQLMIRGIR